MGAITRGLANNILSGGTIDATDGLTGTVPASNINNTSVSAITSMPATVGDFVQSVAADPSPASEGDVWYNSTTGVLKSVVALAAWSSGSPLITARSGLAGAGTQTAALAFGGQTPTFTAETEQYNGLGWASASSMNTARTLTAGTGTQTAALCAGGFIPPSSAATESYNGTTWTSVNSMNRARRTLSGMAGTNTSALVFGGYRDNPPGPTGHVDDAESWNGTSWTTSTVIPFGNYGLGGCGTQTAALGFGGGNSVPSLVATTIFWNGSSWTTGGDLNTARQYVGSGGNSTAALAFGGDTGPVSTAAELYNGTSWTNTSSLGTGRSLIGSARAGNQNAGLGFGGYQPGPTRLGLTEEFNISSNVITAAAWASGGNTNTAGYGTGGSGTQTAGLIYGRSPSPVSGQSTEEYDGTSWTAGGNLNTGRTYIAGFGIQTATIAAGGNPAPTKTAAESYNGSTWTSVTSINTGRFLAGSSGTQTSGLIFGGDVGPGFSTATEKYDGSTWTSTGNLNTARYGIRGVGTQTATIAFGGLASGPVKTGATESFNGTSWTSNPNSLNIARASGGAAGSGPSSALLFGGDASTGYVASTESWNGTNWATAPSMATARGYLAGFGSQTSALGATGYMPGSRVATEEFTGETVADNVKTITTS